MCLKKRTILNRLEILLQHATLHFPPELGAYSLYSTYTKCPKVCEHLLSKQPVYSGEDN